MSVEKFDTKNNVHIPMRRTEIPIEALKAFDPVHWYAGEFDYLKDFDFYSIDDGSIDCWSEGKLVGTWDDDHWIIK